MRNNETGEFELVVGNRQLLSGFFIVVLLFARGLRDGLRGGPELAAVARKAHGGERSRRRGALRSRQRLGPSRRASQTAAAAPAAAVRARAAAAAPRTRTPTSACRSDLPAASTRPARDRLASGGSSAAAGIVLAGDRRAAAATPK